MCFESICAISGRSVFVALRLCEDFSACFLASVIVKCLRRLFAVALSASCGETGGFHNRGESSDSAESSMEENILSAISVLSEILSTQ